VPGSLVENQQNVFVFGSASVFSEIVKNDLESLGVALRQDIPNRVTGLGSNKSKKVKPLVLGLYLDNGALTLGSPNAFQAWDKPNTMLVTGPEFYRFIKVLGISDGFWQRFF
jgi:hypothetical protein